jgi:hypothetical protein
MVAIKLQKEKLNWYLASITSSFMKQPDVHFLRPRYGFCPCQYHCTVVKKERKKQANKGKKQTNEQTNKQKSTIQNSNSLFTHITKNKFQSKHTYLLTYLLTYSMVQSPSWTANWFAASQEIPHISRNPKVHYRTHKGPPPVSILDQPNPVHIPTPHLLDIHPNIIHPSTPRSPQWSLSLRFPHQDPIHPPLHS